MCVYDVEKPSMAEDVIEICRGLQEIRYQGGQKRKKNIDLPDSLIVNGAFN